MVIVTAVETGPESGPETREPRATLHTSKGDVTLRLFAELTPRTVENFVGLATGDAPYTRPNGRGGTEGPFYDGTIFHRVIEGFVLQAGDPTGTGQGGPGYAIEDEIVAELRFTRPYLLAMVSSGPGTNGSQFFITLASTTWLDTSGYTIFGEVADDPSREVVDAIATSTTGQGDRPVDDIVIEGVTVDRAT